MLPNFFIVGAQKAGTTSMYSYLAECPDVCMAGKKEVHFFDIEERYSRGLAWYEQFFTHYNGEQAVGENSPLYMYLDVVPPRIARDFPDARLIFLLRDPVQRAWSHYWHEVKKGREYLGFRDALAAEKRRLQKSFRHRRNYSYVDRGRYLAQIQNYERCFAREQMHFVISEEMHADPHTALRGVLRFLGVDDGVLPANTGERKNAGKVPRSKLVSYAVFNTFLNYIPVLSPAIKKLNLKEDRETMHPDDLRYLHGMFREDNRKLAQYLQRDLQLWEPRKTGEEVQ